MDTPKRGSSRLADIARRAMTERDLEPDFSPAALAELKALKPAAAQGERDLRALAWCSIDNDDSLDLDQLSVAGDPHDGLTPVLVAIADVDALVRKGSALDEHAAHNTTSVYTAAGIFPMLPPQLSTDMTSLNEGQERLAMVIEMQLAEDGSVRGSDVYRARVFNHAKLAYNSVAAWLDGEPPIEGLRERLAAVPALENQLRTQDRLAQAMKRLRHQHGALSLRTPEARPVFDGDAVTDLKIDAPNRAKELIEEFMVAANGVTARFLEERGLPSVRRVLRSPERWERIRGLAAGLGDRLPETADSLALEGFLTRRLAAEPDRYEDLSLTVVKLLGRGEYVLDMPGGNVPGHFGLSVSDYAHSTAPNRRFPDLITQRLVKAALEGKPIPYSQAELTSLAERCTRQEDGAAKVERRVRKSAAALLMARRIGERFDAIVTGASATDTWVRIRHPAVEGRLSKGAQGLDVGDSVRVELIHTDVERGFVDFARARG